MKRATFVAYTLSASALAPIGALASPPVTVAQSGNLAIRMGAITGDQNSEPYYAGAIHAFERAGLDVTITQFTKAGDLMTAMVGGALDVGMGDLIQISHAVIAGVPFAIFAGASLYLTEAPFTVFITAKDGPIRTAKDLEGKTVGVYSVKSFGEYATREWLRQNGADPALIQFVEIPISEVVVAVQRARVAAALMSEPYLSTAKDQVTFFGKPYDAVAKRFILSSFYARREWLTTNASAAKKLVGAINDTARWANTHEEQTAPILSQISKIPIELVRSSHRARYATSLDPGLLQPVLDIAAKYNALPRPVSVNELIMRFPA